MGMTVRQGKLARYLWRLEVPNKTRYFYHFVAVLTILP